MSWPKRIVIVRHGESTGNVMTMEELQRTNNIHHAFSLTERGIEQARSTGEYLRLRYQHFDEYFVSTYVRNQETFKHMFPLVKPIIDSRLNEQQRGIWNTLTYDRLLEIYPEEEAVKEREGWYHYRPPGGQSCQDVEVQVHSFIDTLRRDHSGKSVLITAHGNWQLMFWRVVLNKTVAEVEQRYHSAKYKNASVTVYKPEGNRLTNVLDNFVPFEHSVAQALGTQTS